MSAWDVTAMFHDSGGETISTHKRSRGRKRTTARCIGKEYHNFVGRCLVRLDRQGRRTFTGRQKANRVVRGLLVLIPLLFLSLHFVCRFLGRLGAYVPPAEENTLLFCPFPPVQPVLLLSHTVVCECEDQMSSRAMYNSDK
ncbi:hypothetical protein CONLIGDRAFT_359852 [Coniochaeta ligniaria NRRL 30616]|uniref:Transmembrane protein n=1 Tax=Coniochaeta ligniaria NRRL 30616 TaxID=1408157 RepID=A0A1J7JLQ7_9PEZI|nr:hypothetical protein CONLIGDRAFT_359852 [Coniochaeta ligniaria NRRL 30616]